MGLVQQGRRKEVEAASAEFLKLCQRHGMNIEQVIQTAASVAAAGIIDEANGDKEYAKELLDRVKKSLDSAVEAMVPR